MNRAFITDTKKQLETLIDTFAKLIGDQFEGLGPGQRYLTDEEFVRWFDLQVQGIPGPDEPVLDQMGQPMVDAMGQPMMQPGWKQPPRPNFLQMLLQPGVENGRAMVLRYAKLTGAQAIMPVLTRQYAKGESDATARV